jgi:hypothetical protein
MYNFVFPKERIKPQKMSDGISGKIYFPFQIATEIALFIFSFIFLGREHI